jgi:tetratricopeptide (TPR) repeat protein
MKLTLFVIALLSIYANAQQPTPQEPPNLVQPARPGRIVLPLRSKLVLFSLMDHGERPVIQYAAQSDGVAVSYILFPNLSGKPTSEGCREDVLKPLLLKMSGNAAHISRSAIDPSNPSALAVASYYIDSMLTVELHQQNAFGFIGDKTTCAEIHLSKDSFKPSDQPLLDQHLSAFHPDLTYIPRFKDVFKLASLLFRTDPGSAAIYYQQALNLLPNKPEVFSSRRIVTDQLAMSLGMSGQIPQSKAILEAAIASDPDYPLNHYNLACADAEKKDAKGAALNLKLAFDRKANTLPGEHLPDPTKDDSLLKLKKDKDFWALATSLSTP